MCLNDGISMHIGDHSWAKCSEMIVFGGGQNECDESSHLLECMPYHNRSLDRRDCREEKT